MTVITLSRLGRFLDKLKELFITSGGAATVKSLKVTGGSASSIMRGDGSSVSYENDKLELVGLYQVDTTVSEHLNLGSVTVTSDNVVEVVQNLVTALGNAKVLKTEE